jgi:glycosyltransferase involved in cell wall biosynthesis
MVKSLEDPETAQRIYDACDSVMMLSHYQARGWMEKLHLPQNKLFFTSNGISSDDYAIDIKELRHRKPHAYYSSVPWRGLKPLLDAWPLIRSAVSHAELHVFSSMKVYRIAESPELEQLYDQARKMEGVVYRGSVGQKELREAAQTCRVLAYPCVFPETSCIAAMEAMAAGCVVVGTALGALPETAWRNPLVPLGGNWLERWAFEVAQVLVNTPHYLDLASQNLEISKFYDWNLIAQRWLMKIQADIRSKRNEAN